MSPSEITEINTWTNPEKEVISDGLIELGIVCII